MRKMYSGSGESGDFGDDELELLRGERNSAKSR
jgi:hypothetical protein